MPQSAMVSSVEYGTSTVPAFLTKLWSLVDDETTNEFICWDMSGKTFHVFDQARFAKEVLPLYFKHSNIASFIRQLNMYGFRKVSMLDSGSMKVERDDVVFQHNDFQQGKEELLEFIKRKPTGTSRSMSHEEVKMRATEVDRVLTDVKDVKSRQENMSTKLDGIKRENEALWREIANLRQKHSKQQTIVNKLVQFLIHLVSNSGRSVPGLKRPLPMLNDASQLAPPAKMSKVKEDPSPPFDTYKVESPPNYDNILTSTSQPGPGPVIHDVTDLGPNNSYNLFDIGDTGTLSNLGSKPNITLPDSTLVSDVPVHVSELPTMTLGAPIITYDPTEGNVYTMAPNVTPGYSVINLTSQQQTPNTSTTTSSATAVDKVDSINVDDQLDTIQTEIDTFKSLLAAGKINLDASTLLGLFNPEPPTYTSVFPNCLFSPDSSMPTVPDTIIDDSVTINSGALEAFGSTTNNEQDQQCIMGNEVIQYNSNDLLLSPLFEDSTFGQFGNDDLTTDTTTDTTDLLSTLNTPEPSTLPEPNFGLSSNRSTSLMEEVD